jgi:hypothetical protein
MHEQIEVVYENGVLRPLLPLPYPLQEHQYLTVTIEGSHGAHDWLADAVTALCRLVDAAENLDAALAGATDQFDDDRELLDQAIQAATHAIALSGL